MAIDAVIVGVQKKDDGTVRLVLEPREPGTCAGQVALTVENPRDGMESCIGTEIWGGANDIMVGETRWAERVSYTRIRLVNPTPGGGDAAK